jgi:hypothetical protein
VKKNARNRNPNALEGPNKSIEDNNGFMEVMDEMDEMNDMMH